MSFAKVYGAQTYMLDAHIVAIEVDLSRGLHAFSIVGLPDKAVEESRDRMSAAIKNSGFTSPKSKNQKVVISLAPADLKKEGPIFDLGMALAYLLAAKDITFNSEKKLFLGELSLDGETRPVQGVLPLVREAKEQGFEEVYMPVLNAREGALVSGISVFAVANLKQLIQHLSANNSEHAALTPHEQTEIAYVEPPSPVSFEDVRGQASAKRGLEIAAAGGHNIALYGPPGTGKTMLAKAFTHILPPLSFDEALEVTAIHSVAGKLGSDLITNPPFRSPHHTASYVSMVGGGAVPKPGEVTLAHRGVLFLDEFPEFERRVIDTLREPLEEHVVSISRARGSADFPANFTLVASMNPCPCGNFGSQKECVCTPTHFARYQRKMSGPIMDRIDMWIEVPNITHATLGTARSEGETSNIRERVLAARNKQQERFSKCEPPIAKNGEMGVRDLERFVQISSKIRAILDHAAQKLDLSPRAYHRVIKLARTIADLEDRENIEEQHILEALQYRPKQSQY